VLQSVVMVPRP